MARRRAAQAHPPGQGAHRGGGSGGRARLVPHRRGGAGGGHRPLRRQRSRQGAGRGVRVHAREGRGAHLEMAGGEARSGAMKPAARLNEFGQSAWLDLIGRKLIRSGELKRMIQEDGVRGVTANPAIFEKAIVESSDYDDELKSLIEQGKSPLEIYETIAIHDVRDACDVFRPLFDRLGGRDGFVSLEVSPYIARDTQATG